MVIQKKYYMIALLSISGVSYGMEFFADLITKDPLELHAARRGAEIQRTTREINRNVRAAARIESQSDGYYKLVGINGPMRVVVPTEKQLNMPKPKL